MTDPDFSRGGGWLGAGRLGPPTPADPRERNQPPDGPVWVCAGAGGPRGGERMPRRQGLGRARRPGWVKGAPPAPENRRYGPHSASVFRPDPVRDRTIRRARLSSLAAPDRGLVDPGLAFEVLSTRLISESAAQLSVQESPRRLTCRPSDAAA